jgi:hypothetical protein
MGALNTSDLIEEAARLLTDPIDLGDWTPPECETIEQVEAAEAEERTRLWHARLDAYIAGRADRLALLRYVHAQALERARAYDEEAKRWQRLRDRQDGLADYCGTRVRDLLVMERQVAGAVGPYRVELPNGVKMGLRVTRAVEASVDELAPQWVREKVSREPDKLALKKALERGEVVHGARLVEREHVDWGR